MHYQELYLAYRFFWNVNISELLTRFGDKEIDYTLKDGRSLRARFRVEAYVKLGAGYGQYMEISRVLGESVAPVGDCHNGQIELIITESGKLFGFHDYLLLTWTVDQSWSSSIDALLSGNPCQQFAMIEE